MVELERLHRSIQTAEQLHAIARTMKALAATGIRQFEQAVEALSHYHRTVEMGFQVLLRRYPGLAQSARPAAIQGKGVIVIGSDQGMCGALNDRIVELAAQDLQERSSKANRVIVVGLRAESQLLDRGCAADLTLSAPGSLDAIVTVAQRIVLAIDQWHLGSGIEHIVLCHHRYHSGSSWEPIREEILPLDQSKLSDWAGEPWPTRCIPTFSIPVQELLVSLTHQYFFVSLFRAFTEALASENAARLLAMQAAEKNILERLEALQSVYHRERQAAITSEMLDVISGAESLANRS